VDNIKFEAPEEKKTVLKILGIPVFSRTETITVRYDTTNLYKELSEKISNELVESLKKAGVVR